MKITMSQNNWQQLATDLRSERDQLRARVASLESDVKTLRDALDNALNCMVPTGDDTRTDRAIAKGETALAATQRSAKP